MKRESKMLFGLAILASGLGACQYVPFLHHAAKAAPTAANLTPPAPYALEDRLYAHAVTALEQRDYGLALDVLQMARESRPDDPRVLTAMGVVYDKLGRYDLSARYYDLAEKADPGSKVVAADRAYSLRLQHGLGGGDGADGVLVMSRYNVRDTALSLAGPEPITAQQAVLFNKVIAAGVRVRNATGRTEGADQVKRRLTVVGWTVSRGVRLVEPQRVAFSKVSYPAGVARVAKALARTLPYPVRLAACAECTQLQVVVGADALARPAAVRTTDVRHG